MIEEDKKTHLINYRKNNRDKIRVYVRRCRLKFRLKAIEKLGGKCVRCGYSDIRALQIDHVNGGGCEELRLRGYDSHGYHKRVIEDTTGKYQLLCANCNWIKRYENKETRKII